MSKMLTCCCRLLSVGTQYLWITFTPSAAISFERSAYQPNYLQECDSGAELEHVQMLNMHD